MNKYIFCDLDGTIIDVYDRYVGILNDFLHRQGAAPVKRSEYIKIKVQGAKDHEIVKQLTGYDLDIKQYLIYKHKELEQLERLKSDYLLCDLGRLKDPLARLGYDLKLLTLRMNKDNCLKQLDWLNIRSYFTEILIAENVGHGNPKAEKIKNNCSRQSIMIGDSMMDMECAELLGMKGYYVKTGLCWTKEYPMYETIEEAVTSIVKGAVSEENN